MGFLKSVLAASVETEGWTMTLPPGSQLAGVVILLASPSWRLSMMRRISSLKKARREG